MLMYRLMDFVRFSPDGETKAGRGTVTLLCRVTKMFIKDEDFFSNCKTWEIKPAEESLWL